MQSSMVPLVKEWENFAESERNVYVPLNNISVPMLQCEAETGLQETALLISTTSVVGYSRRFFFLGGLLQLLRR